MTALLSIKKIVDTLLDWTVILMFIVIFGVVLAQIYYRYILGSPLVWSEELSRYIFIWVSLLGWVLATRSGTHIRITFFEERLPPSMQKGLNIVFQLCTIGFLAVLVWLGWTMAFRTFGRSAVTIPEISMGMVYAAMPVSATLGIFYVILNLLIPRDALPSATAPAQTGEQA